MKDCGALVGSASLSQRGQKGLGDCTERYQGPTGAHEVKFDKH